MSTPTPVPARDFLFLPLPGLGARHLIERNVLVYRRIWLVIVSGVFEPLFYLLSLGFGLGAIVGDVTLANGQTVPYAAFVAPAMMATSAMNGAIYESTFNIFFKLHFEKTYDGMLATPMGVADVAIGEIGWALMRGTAYAIGFYVVMVLLGLVESAWSVLSIPAAVLIGFAFAAVRHGGHDVHAEDPGLRPHHPRPGPALPVLGDLLPDHDLPARAAGHRGGHAALPGHLPDPLADARRRRAAAAHPGRLPVRHGRHRPGHLLATPGPAAAEVRRDGRRMAAACPDRG